MNIKMVIMGLFLIAFAGIYAADKDTVHFETPLFKIVTELFPDGTRIMHCYRKVRQEDGTIKLVGKTYRDNDHILGTEGTSIVANSAWGQNLLAEEKKNKEKKGKG